MQREGSNFRWDVKAQRQDTFSKASVDVKGNAVYDMITGVKTQVSQISIGDKRRETGQADLPAVGVSREKKVAAVFCHIIQTV